MSKIECRVESKIRTVNTDLSIGMWLAVAVTWAALVTWALTTI